MKIEASVGKVKRYSDTFDETKFGVEIEFFAPVELFEYVDDAKYAASENCYFCTSNGIKKLSENCYFCTSNGIKKLAEKLEEILDFTVLNDNHCNSHYLNWQLKKDSSVASGSEKYIGGFELTSPVLEGEEGLKQLAKVYAVLRRLGCRTNKTCGTHVHFDVYSFFENLNLGGWETCKYSRVIKQVVDTYLEYENTIDFLVIKNRRAGNQFCQSLQNAVNDCFRLTGRYGDLNHSEIFSRIVCNRIGYGWDGKFWVEDVFDSRYYKVNFQSLYSKKTIEIRQLEGTLNFKKVQNWIKLHKCLIHKAFSSGIETRKRNRTFAELTSYLEWDKETSTNKNEYASLFQIYNRNHSRETSTATTV